MPSTTRPAASGRGERAAGSVRSEDDTRTDRTKRQQAQPETLADRLRKLARKVARAEARGDRECALRGLAEAREIVRQITASLEG